MCWLFSYAECARRGVEYLTQEQIFHHTFIGALGSYQGLGTIPVPINEVIELVEISLQDDIVEFGEFVLIEVLPQAYEKLMHHDDVP